jgi:hypothetical protein
VRVRAALALAHDEPVNRGSFLWPLSDDDVRQKFHRNAARALPPAQVEQVAAAVAALDEAPNVGALAAALRT